MLESIREKVWTFDWKNQTYWNNPWVDIPQILSRIERWLYKTKEVVLDLQVYDLSEFNFKCDDLFEFAVHYELVRKANLKYPVIVNNKWNVIDWRHRIVKAILQWKKSIKWVMILNYNVDDEANCQITS